MDRPHRRHHEDHTVALVLTDRTPVAFDPSYGLSSTSPHRITHTDVDRLFR
jgi:hypothetical protein